jgi:hypothetical protein
MARRFTRRFTPAHARQPLWLVLVGHDCSEEHWVRMSIPDEDAARRRLCIPKDVPILIGRP